MAFLNYLGKLRPKAEYVKLFHEIVLDVWKQKQSDAKSMTALIQARLDELQRKRQQLLEAHVYQRTVEEEVYRREDDRLSQELTLTKLELYEAELDQIDIEAVLVFAERLMLDTRRLWIEGTLEQRQRLQKTLFPKGMTYSSQAGFGTREKSLFSRWLALIDPKKDGVASPTGFEPVLSA